MDNVQKYRHFVQYAECAQARHACREQLRKYHINIPFDGRVDHICTNKQCAHNMFTFRGRTGVLYHVCKASLNVHPCGVKVCREVSHKDGFFVCKLTGTLLGQAMMGTDTSDLNPMDLVNYNALPDIYQIGLTDNERKFVPDIEAFNKLLVQNAAAHTTRAQTPAPSSPKSRKRTRSSSSDKAVSVLDHGKLLARATKVCHMLLSSTTRQRMETNQLHTSVDGSRMNITSMVNNQWREGGVIHITSIVETFFGNAYRMWRPVLPVDVFHAVCPILIHKVVKVWSTLHQHGPSRTIVGHINFEDYVFVFLYIWAEGVVQHMDATVGSTTTPGSSPDTTKAGSNNQTRYILFPARVLGRFLPVMSVAKSIFRTQARKQPAITRSVQNAICALPNSLLGNLYVTKPTANTKVATTTTPTERPSDTKRTPKSHVHATPRLRADNNIPVRELDTHALGPVAITTQHSPSQHVQPKGGSTVHTRKKPAKLKKRARFTL